MAGNRFFRTAILAMAVLCMGVGASHAAAEQQQTYAPRTIVDVPWGDGPREFGILNGPEQEPVGPRFFALDKKGNIYIFDIWNEHIKKFDMDGNYEGNIGSDLPTGSSMAVGTNGHIFVQRWHSVDEYLQNGKLLKTHEISRDINLILGYGEGIKFDKWGSLYVSNGYTLYEIGREVGGRFEVLPHKDQKDSKKRGDPSNRRDRRLKTEVKDKHLAMLQILDIEGNILKAIPMHTPESFGGVQVIGQDKEGFIYVEVEIHYGWRGHLEVRKYDEEGNIITVVKPKYGAYAMADKKLEIDSEGNIYIYSTTPEGVQIIKWEQQ